MNLRAVRQGKAGVVLLKHRTEQFYSREHLRRRQGLIANHQHAVLHERPVQRGFRLWGNGTAQVDANGLGPGVIGQTSDFHGSIPPGQSLARPSVHVTVWGG